MVSKSVLRAGSVAALRIAIVAAGTFWHSCFWAATEDVFEFHSKEVR